MQNIVAVSTQDFRKSNHQKSYLLRFSITGHNDGKTARQFISYITETISQTLDIIFGNQKQQRNGSDLNREK